MKKSFLTLFGSSVFFLYSQISVANPLDFPGMIAVSQDEAQAVDVVDGRGQVLMPDQLTQMLKKGQDISLLNPATSDIWRGRSTFNSASYSLQIPDGAQVEMVSNMPSVVGEYRFVVNYQQNDTNQQYQVLMGKKAHNLLLRKSLLEKLGYNVQPVQWVSQLKIKFNGHASLLGFLNDIQNNTEGNPNRWIVNDVKGTDTDTATVQDVILLPVQPVIYSLESGAIPSDIIQGRRVMNALLVPFALTDVPESINSFSWQAGRIINQSVYLSYEWSSWFNPSYQDAQWITRKIAALSEQDWKQIVQTAKIPQEAGRLLLEKLKARRNSLVSLFEIKSTVMPVNTDISEGKNLVKGKLILKEWPGYAGRFSFGDPENPLSMDEVLGFVKSRGISSLLNSSMNYINSYFNNNSHVQGVVNKHVLDEVTTQLLNQALGQGSKSVPLGMYVVPAISGNINLSREIIIGSYMGTDNLVQIADTLGFSVSPGGYVGIDGLLPITQSGFVGLQLQRSYSHIKPIKSMQAANKTPFKNMIVPWLTKSWVSNLGLPDSTGQVDLKAAASALDEDFAAGESIIVTDSVGVQGGLNLTYPASPTVAIQTAFNASQMHIHRTQLYKVDKYTFQVYEDPGRVTRGSVAAGVSSSGFPIISLSVSRGSGVVKTGFFTLTIGSDDENDMNQNYDQYLKNLNILKLILAKNSLETLKADQKPFIIGHQFTDTDWGLRILFMNLKTQKIKDRFDMEMPDGATRSVLYRASGLRTGKDYLSLVGDIVNTVIRKKTGSSNVAVDVSSSGNPGDTPGGSSVTRQVSYEGVLAPAAGANAEAIKSDADSQFAKITNVYKGWSITNKKAQYILDDINRSFGFKITQPNTLANVKKIDLYAITLSMNIYHAGLLQLAKMNKKELEKVITPIVLGFNCMQYLDDPECIQPRQNLSAKIYWLQQRQQQYLNLINSDAEKAADAAIQMVDLAEALMPGRRFVQLVGENNIFVQARIQGFREGDELGDTPLMGSTIGLIGSKATEGPLTYIQQNMKVLRGEFFINWLLSPLF